MYKYINIFRLFISIIFNFYLKFKNIILTKGYSFVLYKAIIDRKVVSIDEYVKFSLKIKNNGYRIGTVYIIIKIAESYNHKKPIYNSHDQGDDRTAFRIIDIYPNNYEEISFYWKIGNNKLSHYDFQIEIWNPHKLYNGPNSYKFYKSSWHGAFEIVGVSKNKQKQVFISYSHDNNAHKIWVQNLVEELYKRNIYAILDNKDTYAGDDFKKFMNKEIYQSKIIILICSTKYTKKANKLINGVGYETKILQKLIKSHTRIIPVIRNNDLPNKEKLPKYIKNIKAINMDTQQWKNQPLSELVISINSTLNIDN